MKRSQKDQTAKQIKITLDRLIRRGKNKTYHTQQNNYNPHRASLEPITHHSQKEHLIARAKKTYAALKDYQEQASSQHLDTEQSKAQNLVSLHTSQIHAQPVSIQRRINAMLVSINKAQKNRVRQAREQKNPRLLKKSNKKRILLKKKFGGNWLQQSSVLTRKYGGQVEQFQKSLQDRYITNRLYNIKASSDLSVDRLNKDYEQHRIIVNLRENYKIISPVTKKKR